MKAIVIAAAACLTLGSGIAAADQALAQRSACMSCHQLDRKVVGPSYRDIANKYKGDAKAAAHLVNVIKKGGKGVWGPVPMPPHPQVSDDNAKRLADWILSL